MGARMKQEQQSLISRLKEQRSVRKHLAVAVCLIAILTAFAVFWLLRISGLTLEVETATGTNATETDTGIATVSDDGISLASADETEDDSNSSTTATVATTSTDFSDYYLAATVDGVPSSGTYIIYTYDEDNETYYVVNSDGELEACKVISSVEEASGDGAYYIKSTGTVVYGSAGASAYSSALWTVTQDDSDGNAYTISHADSGDTSYIAPAGETEDVTIGETAFSGNTGTVTISGDFTLTYTFYNVSKGTDNWENFILEMVSGGVYLDVRADNYGWIGVGTGVTADVNDTVTFGDGSDDWTAWNTAMASGQLCTVKIVKSGKSVAVTTTANEETFTATANMEEYGDNAEISIYLSGQKCTISDVLYTYSCDSDSETGNNLDSSVKNLISDALGYVTFTGKASGGVTMDRGDITAVVTTDSSSGATASWKAYGTASTFYFAAIQTTADDYHFADTVTLAYAAENQGESYITYTKIGDDYYLVSAVDGSLLKCIDISSYSEDQKILLSAGTGAYIWKYVTDEDTGEKVPSFKFTSGTNATDSFANYYWTVSGSVTNKTSGEGSYTIANSAKSDYLAPGVDGTEVKLARNETVSKVATLDSYGTSVFSITVNGYNGGSGTYYTHLQTIVYNSSETIVARLRWNAYATTNSGTAENGWSWSIDRGTGYSLGEFTNIQLGYVITLTVTAASDGLYLNYYNNRSAETYICYFAGLDLSAGYYVNFYTQNGSYTIRSELMGTTEVASDGTVEVNSDAETTGIYTQVTSDTLSSYDFDLTYSFTNKSAGSSLEDNFSIRLDNGLDTSSGDYTYIDVSFNSQAVKDSSGNTNSSVKFYTGGFDAGGSESTLQTIMNSGATCSVRVVRTGTNFFFILSAGDSTANSTYTMYASVTVSAFDGCKANVYLMGQNCTISDITLEGSIYNVADYNRVSANSDALTISAVDSSGNVSSAVSYLWSATASGTFDETLYLIAQLATDTAGTAEIEWVENKTAGANASGTATTTLAGASVTGLSDTVVTTFSFARVTDCFVWFDGTNGGMSSYSASDKTAYDEIMMIPYDAVGEMESITIPSTITDASGYGTTTNASYTLRGWYDIYNGDYYTPGSTVALSGSTVMYADWAVKSYDIGQSNDSTVDTVSTNKFITTRLFDYNELFNLQSETIPESVERTTEIDSATYSMTEYRTLTLTGHRELFVLNASSSIASESTSLGFLFFRTEPSYSFYYSSLGYSVNGNNPLIDYPDGRGDVQTSDRKTINGSNNETTQGILGAYGTSASSAAANGSTTFSTSTATLLSTLFGTGNTVDDVDDPTGDEFILGKTYVGTADYLFQYDSETGYYYYNSEKNSASYNATDKRFYVYDYLVYANQTGSTDDFFPFNYTGAAAGIDTTDINYWYGMSTEIEFYLPSSVDSGENKGIDGYHMTFKFSGDDDVWVFVDGVLVLDLGGVHGQAYGEIDFTTGDVVVVNTVNDDTVYYNTGRGVGIIDYVEDSGYDVKQTAAEEYVKKIGAGTHTLTFYYLERGASQSNAAIYFNISSTTYNLNLSKVDEEDGATELDGAEFTFYTDSKFGTEAELLKSQNGTTAYSTFASTETVYGLLEGVTYYVVETAAPNGYSAEGKYFTILLSDNVLTITVYETGSTEPVELYTYTITYATDGTCTYVLTYANGATAQTDSGSWYYVLGSKATFSASVSSSGAVQYYNIGLTIANTAGYELPATGSVGTGRYMTAGEILVLVAATGLVILAFYQLVWSRKFCAEGNKGGTTKDKARSRKCCAKARERPHKRRENHGCARDRPKK